MSLQAYTVPNDYFEIARDKYGSILFNGDRDFPCCVCAKNNRTDRDWPCSACDHNVFATAQPPPPPTTAPGER